MNNYIKPKLIFFQFKHNQNVPDFTLLHRQQHVKCLSEFFEVVLINEDCDYQQVCDRYQPDLTLFENAGNVLDCQRPTITNTHTHSQIPKIGLLNADPWCNSRAVFLSDMERWGVETFFSIAVTAAEHSPEIADNLFVWPNFIDSEIYKDYNESKIIPVLFTGASYALYPWRQKIIKCISQYYPSLICPHLGYSGQRSTTRMIYGEQYARTINASWFVPTCGTVAKEVVRKHFEIPASKACLITEQSPALEAAGFVDMKNCIFADEHNVLDKLDYLFQNWDELEKIIDAGYHLVHSRHTLKQRNQIYQWFNLYQNLQPHQRIVQTNPFESLIVVEKSSRQLTSHIKCNGLNSSLIQAGDRELEVHQYDRAEASYLKCLYHVGIMHEPKLRLAICSLYKGDAEKALEWIVPLIHCILEIYKASDPDPVEWAYLIVSLLCLGRIEEAKQRCDEFPSLSHIELDRVRWVVKSLAQANSEDKLSSWQISRASVHHLPEQNLQEWIRNICRMLKACNQTELAAKLEAISLSDYVLELNGKKNSNSTNEVLKPFDLQNFLSRRPSKDWRPKNTPLSSRAEFRKKLFNKFRKIGCNLIYLLNSLEDKFGYFLPFQISHIRNNDLSGSVKKLLMEEEIKAVLLIGACSERLLTKVILSIAQKIPKTITVVCVNNEVSPKLNKFQKLYVNNPTVKFYQLPLNSFGDYLHQMKLKDAIGDFDVALIDNSEIIFDLELFHNVCDQPKFFVVDDINTLQGYKVYHYLDSSFAYTLESQNLSLPRGFAIFKKTS